MKTLNLFVPFVVLFIYCRYVNSCISCPTQRNHLLHKLLNCKMVYYLGLQSHEQVVEINLVRSFKKNIQI